MNSRINFFGLNLDLLTMEETLETIAGYIERAEIVQHVVVNVAKLVNAQNDNHLRDIINSCKIINVDGAGIVLGARLLGINIPERVTGIDLMENLIKFASEKGYRIYFLGATEEVVSAVVLHYESKYPAIKVAGYHHGYFSAQQENLLANEIKNSKAHILFVAMGSPKKEQFLNKYTKQMQIPFVMGVGGSFDVIAGKVSRAPLWMQKAGLEWLFRLISEPRRMWKRYLYTNTVFGLLLLKALFNSKKFVYPVMM